MPGEGEKPVQGNVWNEVVTHAANIWKQSMHNVLIHVGK